MALSRASAPAHPFSDPEDLRVGRGRAFLANGDLLTADAPRRLISRFQYEDLIEEMGRDYDLTDPRATEHILGRDVA